MRSSVLSRLWSGSWNRSCSGWRKSWPCTTWWPTVPRCPMRRQRSVSVPKSWNRQRTFSVGASTRSRCVNDSLLINCVILDSTMFSPYHSPTVSSLAAPKLRDRQSCSSKGTRKIRNVWKTLIIFTAFSIMWYSQYIRMDSMFVSSQCILLCLRKTATSFGQKTAHLNMNLINLLDLFLLRALERFVSFLHSQDDYFPS